MRERLVKQRIGRGALAAAAFACALALAPPALEAGTTGKISGRITDDTGEPVFGVNVLVVGTTLGAISDLDGLYNIINIPAGVYDIRFGHVAYQSMVVTGVTVSADQTTKRDARLASSTVALQEIEVRAERPIVDVNLTSTRSTVTTEDIEALPLQEMQDIVNLQAGVVDGHIRGGRLGEVEFQVDGVSVNNPFDNKSALKIDRSLLQEVQVISGVFDAEYGQAMSGVVNAVLKDGGDEFDWTAEIYGGGFVFPENDGRSVEDQFLPTSIGSAQLSVSGPTGLPKTTYLANVRGYRFDDYVRAVRIVRPTDRIVIDQGQANFTPTGDGKEMPLGYTREGSGLLKLTNTSFEGIKLSYQAVFNEIKAQRTAFAYRFNPDGRATQRTHSISHGLDWTHTLTPSTYYRLGVRQNFREYRDMAYDSLWDPRYDAAGAPRTLPELYGAYYGGVDLTRYLQKTNEFLAVGQVVSQVTRDHLVKVGGELRLPQVEFGNLGVLSETFVGEANDQILVRYRDEPPHFPGPGEYHPVIASGYAQDQLEWRDLTVRGGLRVDYFDARSTIPSDLKNPANSIPGAPPSGPKETTAKTVVSPRLGVAIPVSESAGVHFAYGHFYQFPAIGEIFSNADYNALEDLPASTPEYKSVYGNPDVRPEQTVQYEIGYKQAVTSDFGVDVNVFYKDVRDLLGIEFITTYNDAEYPRLTNADFGNVIGFTIALDHRKLGPVTAALDYTWQQAEGNTSDPRETATRASAGRDARPRLIPFNWDQRHTFNATLSSILPEGIAASLVFRAGSGQPYTPSIETVAGFGVVPNSGRKPGAMLVDFRAEKTIPVRDIDLSLFGRIFNLFDTRYFNGSVYESTGSPYYSSLPTDQRVPVDPTRYYAPRRIEVGIKLEPGS